MTTGAGIDVDRVRADTPATAERVLLNHAGASPSPTPVLDVVVGHLRDEARLGGYEAAAARADDVDRARGSIASLVGGRPDEIAFATSATEAWESAFWSFPWTAGDVVLTCRSEYVTNVLNLLVARDRFGVEVRVVDDDAQGRIDVGSLERHLEDPAVRLVAVSHVPTQGGLVNPAEEVGRRCRAVGVPFLLDACQSAGQLPLDVDDLGCDVLTATGRKYLRGPRGTGFLWVRTELAERSTPLGSAGADWTGPDRYRFPSGAARFEGFERSVAGVLGLGAAVDYALDLGLDAVEERVTMLAEHLRAGLADIPGVTVRDRGVRRCGIVTFTVDGIDPAAVRDSLAGDAVHVWTTSASFARIDLGARGIDEMVRASVHYLNTIDELDRAVGLVAALALEDG
jgi:selenocysteine lyase/cysteine desulfurase